MKPFKIMFFTAVVLFLIGELIIVATYLTHQDEMEQVNRQYHGREIALEEDVTDLFIDATGVDVYVSYGDRPSISVTDCYLAGFDYSVEDGMLKITQKDPVTLQLLGWRIPASVVGCTAGHSGRIDVKLPEGMTLNNANLNVGFGDITVEQLTSKRIVTQVGIGSLKVEKVKNNEKYAYQVAFGNTDVNWRQDNN